MVLCQQPQQLPAVGVEALLELGVGERPRLPARKPARHSVKPLPRTGETVQLGQPATVRQDIVDRCVILGRTGVEIGGHAATSNGRR